MKKIFRTLSLITLSALLAVSCIEDNTAAAVNTENPFALDATSDVTTQLEALSTGQIDCLQMNFPITVATYTEGFAIDETLTFNNSAELIAFFNGLGENDTYAIQYPFTITASGEEVDITGNDAFLTTLETEIEECAAATACLTENTPFAQAYNSITADEIFSMDTWSHEYTFSVSQPGVICSIGYKGETSTLEYTIKILDATNTELYSGQHTFSATGMEYISIPEVTLQANTNYTIRRSIQGYGPGSMGIGTIKMAITTADILPVTQGNITIHQARFFGGGGSTDPNFEMVPMIDFAFRPNP